MGAFFYLKTLGDCINYIIYWASVASIGNGCSFSLHIFYSTMGFAAQNEHTLWHLVFLLLRKMHEKNSKRGTKTKKE